MFREYGKAQITFGAKPKRDKTSIFQKPQGSQTFKGECWGRPAAVPFKKKKKSVVKKIALTE